MVKLIILDKLRAIPEFIQAIILFLICSGLNHHRYRKK